MIRIHNLTKSFRVKAGRHYVFRDVSIDIPDGKNVGIIGPNGAGKSTLLRILGGVDHADSGKIESDVRFSWPVGLKGGFVSHLSGRDNSRMVCRFYCRTKEEIRNKIAFIRELSGIGDYFEEPVKYYSSGMAGRLGFALSMAFDFDYYLVDEITSVGDARFKETAREAFEAKAKWSRVIMASHGLTDIKKFCDVVILIRDGELRFFDEVDAAVDAYLPKTSIDGSAADPGAVSAGDDGLPFKVECDPEMRSFYTREIRRKLDRIQSLLREGAVIDGKEDEFYMRLGLVYNQLLDRWRALHYLQKAAELNPYTISRFQVLASCAHSLGLVDIAGGAVRDGLKLDENHPTLRQIAGQIAFQQGELEKAASHFQVIVAAQEKNAGAWNLLARALIGLKRFEEAQRAQLRAVELNDSNAAFFAQLRLIYSLQEKHHEAYLAGAKQASLVPPSPPPIEKQHDKVMELLDSLTDRLVATESVAAGA